MEENYVGQTLQNEEGQEYIVLSQILHKNIPCVYGMQVLENNEEGEKKFFQLVNDDGIKLVSIQSPKMIEELFTETFKQKAVGEKPRKIKKEESIADYFAYLDDYYKSKVVTIV